MIASSGQTETTIDSKEPRRNALVNLSVESANLEVRIPKQIQSTNVKKLELSRFWIFEIRLSDLFRISCFGFPTSDGVKMANIFLRGA